MGKKQVMISVSEELHKEAKGKLMNISEICENALRMALNPKKSDVSEEDVLLKCRWCGELVEEGYICQLTSRFSCKECETAVVKTEHGWQAKHRCISKDHEHYPIPGSNGENKRLIKEIVE